MFNTQDESVHSIEGFNNGTLAVSWTLGNFCVYKCSYCPAFLHDGSVPFHSVDLVLSTLNKLPKNTIVTLLGGEPTYHPDFEQISLEKPNHIRLSMVTNGAKPLSFWQKIAPNMSIIAFTFHPEFANVDRFIENSKEVSKHIKDFRIFLMMIPEKWDYCVEVYDKLKVTGLIIAPKPILENFNSVMHPSYNENQLAWIAERNRSNFKSITIFDADRNVLHKTNPNDLLATGQTDFTGFKCYVPQQHLAIELDQNIYTGKCKQKTIIGNLSSEKIIIPEDPVLCTQQFCKCQSDIVAKKSR
jgi:MoaA/NifB/PqqE/SkfB family radical SAM enzyme